MKTVEEVASFINMLDLTDCLWHADDSAVDSLTKLPLENREALQALMEQAKVVCANNCQSIWDYYPSLE